MKRSIVFALPRLALGILLFSALSTSDAANPMLERRFTQTVRPFLTQYCVACHSGANAAAQLDLKSYATVDSVLHDYRRWAIVRDKLTAEQMPPKQMPQPPAEVRKQVADWIDAARADGARRTANDPGPVLARRLSNAEYDYTIRDLTGVDMRPAREFPVDPANQAGFDNSGESLAMSPALLKKYLQAARSVADHMVLTPAGFDFAPYPMLVETDREKYAIQRIVNFYKAQPTDYADYFQAAWRYKNRVALGKPNSTIIAIAADAKVSPKYLPMIWQFLNDKTDEVGPVEKLRTMWRALPDAGEAQPEVLRAKCVEMRDFVVRIRHDTALEFTAPKVKNLRPTSQPLMNWKLREFAAHRRDFDPKSLRRADETAPAVPPLPRYPGLGEESAPRAAILMLKARAADPDLVVPAGQFLQYENAFARLSSVFPDVFYVSERGRYFPDDSQDKGRLLSAGFHNVMGYFRDDTPLIELILDDKGKKHLDSLWDEFDFIADYTVHTWTQYFFNQSGEVLGKGGESGQDRPTDRPVTAESVIFGIRDMYLAKAAADPTNDPVASDAIRDHYRRVNSTIRAVEKMRVDAEPRHLDALLKFAARAYRRPLTKAERDDMTAYYRKLRDKESLTHEDAIRESLVSVLMSPDFCYRIDLLDAQAAGQSALQQVALKTPAPAGAHPLSSYALATRLSYFLWASMPDQQLLAHAAAGDLQNPTVLLAQTRRLLKDSRVEGFVTEFAGNWLDFRRFEQHNGVDRARFPGFTNELREAMFEEPIRFIEDAIQNNRSVLDLLYAKYTFVNPALAKHYGMPEVKGTADTWVRVDDAGQYGRGGLLPMSVFLTQSSPGLRTSPVKRGNWVVKRVLGEVIPPPPPVVPELPSDESKSDLPVRDMLAKHRENAMCAACHARFDNFGLAFEGYGPVGDARKKDMAGRDVDATAVFPGGMQGSGFQGVVDYIREHRQKDFIDNISRKMLTYALNRSLQLSDEPLIERMQTRLVADGYKIDSLVETIVTSPQFLNKRGAHPSRTQPAKVAAMQNLEEKKGE